MRKLLLLFLAFLCSCERTDIINSNKPKHKIAWDIVSVKNTIKTKAIIESGDMLTIACTPEENGGKGKSIGFFAELEKDGNRIPDVFGTKETQLIFKDKIGSPYHWNYIRKSGEIELEDLEWEEGATYHIRAYFPQSLNNLIEKTTTAHCFVMEYNTHKTQEDLLIAYNRVYTEDPIKGTPTICISKEEVDSKYIEKPSTITQNASVYGYDEDFDLNTPIPLFFQHSLAAIRIRFKYDFDVTGSDELYVDDELLNCYFTNIDDENGLHTTGAFVFGNEHTDHPESYYRESLEQYETLEGYWKTFSWRSHQSSMTNVPYYRWGLSQEEANAIVAGTYDYKGTRISRHSRIVDGNRIVSDSMAVAYTKFRTRDIVKTNKTTNSTNSETIVDETPGELTMSIKIEGPYYNENDGWLFIIPQQAVSGLKFNFTTKRMGLISTLVPPYTMTGADGPIDYSPGSDPLANAKAETNYYLPGYRYTYTLTISQTNIRLDISIDDWNEINATQDIVF